MASLKSLQMAADSWPTRWARPSSRLRRIYRNSWCHRHEILLARWEAETRERVERVVILRNFQFVLAGHLPRASSMELCPS